MLSLLSLGEVSPYIFVNMLRHVGNLWYDGEFTGRKVASQLVKSVWWNPSFSHLPVEFFK